MKQSILVRAMEEAQRENKERMGSQRGQGETKHFGNSYGGDRERESKERTMEETERERVISPWPL